jgi:hypothetical protein
MRPFVLACTLFAIFGSVSLVSHSQTPLTPDQQAKRDQDKLEADLAQRGVVLSELSMMRQTRGETKQDRDNRLAWRAAHERLVELRKAGAGDQAKYRAFLASVKGGLFRLFPDFDCVTASLIRSDGPCSGFVDGGSAYSFRAKNYFENAGGSLSFYPYNDIRLDQGKIISKGFLEHGIIVMLGDVPLEGVKLSDPGLKFLLELKPAATRHEADDLELKLDKRIRSGEYVYSNIIDPRDGVTYAMRMIAYGIRGIDFNGEITAAGYKYYWLSYDKRADLTIAFRIIRRDESGVLTILWKELTRKKTPAIKF